MTPRSNNANVDNRAPALGKPAGSEAPSVEAQLWIPILLPPIAWALEMEINYSLVPFQCYGGSRLPLMIVGVVALLTTIVAALLAFILKRTQRTELKEIKNAREKRMEFMTTLGLMLSGMFGLVIASQIMAILFLHPCLR